MVLGKNSKLRLTILPVDEVLPIIKYSIGAHKFFHSFYGRKVKIKSRKLIVFLKGGTYCHKCGLAASYFALETDPKDLKGYWYLSLYGIKDGREIEFTMDHILPRSRGGCKAGLYNLQPMCYCCNQKKGNSIEQ